MNINGKKIGRTILRYLKEEISSLSKTKKLSRPKLVVISVKPSPQDKSFIKAKEKAARTIGADFQLILFKIPPRFEEFAEAIKKAAIDAGTTAVIIQKPLPPSLSTVTLFNYIPVEKEIEANKNKTPFSPPIGLSVLSVIKYFFHPGEKTAKNLLVNLKSDGPFFKQLLKHKKIVILGRGETGGKPIGDTLSSIRINYINLNSKTPSPENFLNSADIVITAVGKPSIDNSHLKPGVLLIGVGIAKRGGNWQGDYDEEQIKKIAAGYTPTPGGVGPIDVAYLMYNLVEAWKLQNK